jgi:hypothetical protein
MAYTNFPNGNVHSLSIDGGKKILDIITMGVENFTIILKASDADLNGGKVRITQLFAEKLYRRGADVDLNIVSECKIDDRFGIYDYAESDIKNIDDPRDQVSIVVSQNKDLAGLRIEVIDEIPNNLTVLLLGFNEQDKYKIY